jgi:branched-chain amino acid transport system ATP-binding protein
VEALLSIRNVHKSFGALKAVQGISLDVPAGVVTAVIGPNGAGKTTLFNCISGVTQANEAQIRLRRPGRQEAVALENREVEEICRLGIARTFQQVRLFDSLSVLDNVVLGGLHRQDIGWGAAVVDRLLFGRKRHKLLRDDAAQYLQRVGLEKHAHQLAGSLDHGNRRRIEIARALAAHPLVLLLDEPAAGMNRVETDELMVLLRGLCSEGLGVLLIEHDMKLVMQVSNRVYVMDHGELLTFGTPEEVTADPRVIEAYLGSTGQRYAAS